MPSERELGSAIKVGYDPDHVQARRQATKREIALGLTDIWQTAYAKLPITAYEDTAEAMGVRAWRNVVLDMALTAGIREAKNWAVTQYQQASCMTERLGALAAMLEHDLPPKNQWLADFYERFSRDALVMDLWFSVQAHNPHASVADIFALTRHTDFDINTPNRVRAVLSGLLSQPSKLWTAQGLSQYLVIMEDLDKRNPLLASRLLQGLSHWDALTDAKKAMAQQHLSSSRTKMTSKNVKETLSTMLNN